MTIWAKRSGTSGQNFIISNGASTGSHWGMALADSSGQCRYYMADAAGAGVDTNGATNVSDNVWHHLVVTWDGSAEKAELFVDGRLDGSTTAGSSTATMTNSSATLAIGARHDGAQAADQTTLALCRISANIPTATQVREMYDAEKGMFVANAECLLQSGSTDAVLDVDVDPLSGKVIVTQTDAITVFDGLVVDSKPTVNSGASEKGKLWGDLRAEQNSANAYVTAPATDQRQVNEMVRGLASDLPAGVDLSKAKAWGVINTNGTIYASYNVKSTTSGATGTCRVDFGIPFKSGRTGAGGPGHALSLTAMGDGSTTNGRIIAIIPSNSTTYFNTNFFDVVCSYSNTASTGVDTVVTFVAFGELENE